jgi:hypothetical protein
MEWMGIWSRGLFHLTALGICPEETRNRKKVIQLLRPKFEGCVLGTQYSLKGIITCVRDYTINKLQQRL